MPENRSFDPNTSPATLKSVVMEPENATASVFQDEGAWGATIEASDGSESVELTGFETREKIRQWLEQAGVGEINDQEADGGAGSPDDEP
jgi:hypothetical protein